jgi:hypothetical protein
MKFYIETWGCQNRAPSARPCIARTEQEQDASASCDPGVVMFIGIPCGMTDTNQVQEGR